MNKVRANRRRSKLIPVLVILAVSVGIATVVGVSLYTKDVKKPVASVTTPKPAPAKRDPNTHDFEDADYAKKMLLYHQLAVELDQIAIAKATQPEVRLFAEENSRRETEQAAVYATMLNKWGETYINLTDFPDVNGCFGYPTFSGMLPHTAIRTYRTAEGTDVDKQYLQLTMTHHTNLSDLIKDNGWGVGYGELIKAQVKTKTVQESELKDLKTMLGVIKV